MLSQENAAKLDMNGLYQHEIPEPYGENTHCKNWTFTVDKIRDGLYYMVDTYWADSTGLCIELTDDNFSGFSFVFNWDNVKTVNESVYWEYRGSDRWNVATDSGGWSYPKRYVRKDAKPSKELKCDILLREIEEAKAKVDCLERYVVMLNKDGMGGFYD